MVMDILHEFSELGWKFFVDELIIPFQYQLLFTFWKECR